MESFKSGKFDGLRENKTSNILRARDGCRRETHWSMNYDISSILSLMLKGGCGDEGCAIYINKAVIVSAVTRRCGGCLTVLGTGAERAGDSISESMDP